ncbi:hypothetical protein [Kribbella hippodromi]
MTEQSRRTFVQRLGLVAGATAVLPVVGTPASAVAGLDPDKLFKSGRFAEADRAYTQVLRGDPSNTHATAQRGYVALLSNNFAAADGSCSTPGQRH